MAHEIVLGAPWPERRLHDLARDDSKVGNQTQRAVPFAFEFAAFRLPLAHWLRWRDALQGLDAGHFVTTHDMAAQGMQQRGIGVECTNSLDLLRKGDRINGFGLGVQPVAGAMC